MLNLFQNVFLTVSPRTWLTKARHGNAENSRNIKYEKEKSLLFDPMFQKWQGNIQRPQKQAFSFCVLEMTEVEQKRLFLWNLEAQFPSAHLVSLDVSYLVSRIFITTDQVIYKQLQRFIQDRDYILCDRAVWPSPLWCIHKVDETCQVGASLLNVGFIGAIFKWHDIWCHHIVALSVDCITNYLLCQTFHCVFRIWR